MKKQVVFIQGGGDGGYKADAALVTSLKAALGKGYDVEYPEIKSDESAPDFGWIQQINRKVNKANDDVILVGHSFGASMILKCLSENSVNKKIRGIFLISTPFWRGSEDWKKGLKLKNDFADKLPGEVPIFFYHCRDDGDVQFSDMGHYRQKLPLATFREIEKGGHQLNNDLTLVANDIKNFMRK